ncbi:MAG: AAC(3) family N-acetyltransferase [Chloroflexi bacterium]|nr:AAC(3) family N-acetyltransferase [Chloroflexota bacterium]
MTEPDVIKKTKTGPITVLSLMDDLSALGVTPGMTLMVHSSLSEVGWASGGPVAVIQALENIIGADGTLVMPTHSGDLSDPEDWSNPPVPQEWKEKIRQSMPAFEPDLTPTRGMGRIPETFRKQAGVLRSCHPHTSFAAWGEKASFIIENHALDFALGDNSPLARIYDLNGWILLLGVGHDSNTSLHLAEFRAEYTGKKNMKQGAPVLVAGERHWIELNEIKDNTDDFPEIGKAYQQAGGTQKEGKIGLAKSILIPQQELVDFAIQWMKENRRIK